MIEHIKDLKAAQLFTAILGFGAVLSPGFLTIYHYHPELVQQLDSFKLIVFSLSLSVPVLILQSFGTGMAVVDVCREQPDASDLLFYGALGTSAAMFSSLSTAYFLHIPFRWFIGIVAIASVTLIFVFRRVLAQQAKSTNS